MKNRNLTLVAVLVTCSMLPVMSSADDLQLYKTKQQAKKLELFKAFSNNYYTQRVETLAFQTLKYETYLLGRGYVNEQTFLSSQTSKNSNINAVVFDAYKTKVLKDLAIDLDPASVLSSINKNL